MTAAVTPGSAELLELSHQLESADWGNAPKETRVLLLKACDAIRLAAKPAEEPPIGYRWRYTHSGKWTFRKYPFENSDLIVCEPVYLSANVSNEAVAAWRNFMAQLIVKDAEHPGNVTIVEQPFPASVFDKALAAALSTTGQPKP